MVVLLLVDETWHQNSEKLSDGGRGESAAGAGKGARVEISQVGREEALDIGVKQDNTDAAKARMKLKPSEGEGQAVEMVVGIDDGDRLQERGRASNRGIV